MSRVPMSDELPWWDGLGSEPPRCERCADELEEGDAELCADCRAEEDAEEDELFGTPATRRGTWPAALTPRQREDAEDLS